MLSYPNAQVMNYIHLSCKGKKRLKNRLMCKKMKKIYKKFIWNYITVIFAVTSFILNFSLAQVKVGINY